MSTSTSSPGSNRARTRVRVALAMVAVALVATVAASVQPASALHRDESWVVPKGAYPWATAVYWSGKSFCSGTLIKANFVLTAAHCVTEGKTVAKASQVSVTIGRSNLLDPKGGGEKRSVASVIVFTPYLNDPDEDDDLALLKLSSNSTMTPLKAASPYIAEEVALDNRPDGYSYKAVVELGYGNQCNKCSDAGETLRGAVTLIVNGGPNNFETVTNLYDDEDFICKGDSGGPVFAARKDGKLRLVGVHSQVIYDSGDDPTCGYQAINVKTARQDVNTWLVTAGAF